MSYAKPVALVTGAAKRIGAMIARHLAANGYDLVLHFHHSEKEAQALAAELTEITRVILHRADLTGDLGDFWRGMPECELLVLNASIYERTSFEEMTAAQLRAQLAVNLEAPLLLAQGFMKQLPPAAMGNIIVLGDGATGWSLAPQFFPYAVSKHAWASVIDLLAAAVAPRARANLLALPPILPNHGEDQALFDRLGARTPLQRSADPTEICTAIDFLRASPGVTGQIISLANGLNLATARPQPVN